MERKFGSSFCLWLIMVAHPLWMILMVSSNMEGMFWSLGFFFCWVFHFWRIWSWFPLFFTFLKWICKKKKIWSWREKTKNNKEWVSDSSSVVTLSCGFFSILEMLLLELKKKKKGKENCGFIVRMMIIWCAIYGMKSCFSFLKLMDSWIYRLVECFHV